MENQGYISKKKKGTSLYEELHQEAIEILQKLCGDVWTDYNEHDPGVTLLENISYAITEIAHKAKLPVQDLLTAAKKAALVSGDNGLFTAADILTTTPVTFNDFRKIWIDQIPNVKNVWVYAVDNDESELNNLKGVLRVFVEKHKYDSRKSVEEKENAEIKAKIRTLYQQHRNLCERLYTIDIYKPLSLKMDFRITITDLVDGEEVLANILHRINEYLAPEVSFHSLNQLKKEGLSINEIFNGPRLSNGFIKEESLHDPLKTIHISDIIKAISKIAGIVNINHFCITYEDPVTKQQKRIQESYTLPENMTARIAFPITNKQLIFENAGVSFQPDLLATKKQLSFIQALDASKFKAASNSQNTLEIPAGNLQDITTYYPIRKQLPEIYGIGDRGISGSASPLRQAQTKQLKAYLLPFDQLIINFLAQLSNIYSLYDIQENNHASYFTNSVPDIEEITELIEPIGARYTIEELRNYWEEVTNGLNQFFDNRAPERLNKIADELLSRYHEAFQTYSLRKIYDTSYGGILPEDDSKKQLLSAKQELIKEYGTISYNRSKALNYKNENNGINITDNSFFSGIFKKIAILTNITNRNLISFTEIIDASGIILHPKSPEIDIYIHEIIVDTPIGHFEIDEIEFEITDDNIGGNLREIMHYVGAEDTILNDVLAYGINSNNYHIKKVQNEEVYYVLFKRKSGEFQVTHIATSKSAAIASIKKAIDFLVKINQKSEGFFVLEHTQLLPSFFESNFGFEIDFSLLDTALEMTWVHYDKTTFVKRNTIISSLINDLLNKKLSYEIQFFGGVYRLLIGSSEGDILARSKNDFLTEKAANNAIKNLQSIVVNFEKEHLEVLAACYVYYGNKPVDEQFFSFRMSFIMPSWPVRFQNENFKKIFETTVYEELPIHIHSDIYWLHYNELQLFERYYFKWLSLLKMENPTREIEEKIQGISYELIRLLQQFNNEY